MKNKDRKTTVRCPNVNELPLPPVGKTGWPWTEGTPQASECLPDNKPWPKISITTPNYNCGQFLEETIRSILLQGYPNLEYFIIDGGSTDDSLAIIKKYTRWITYWVSEPDQGQAHAINKGFTRSMGEVLQWINSDDLLTPHALIEVGRLAGMNAGAMIGGGCEWFGQDVHPQVVHNQKLTRADIIAFWRRKAIYQQPSLYVPSGALAVCGPVDETLRYCFDLDWYIRLLSHFPVVYTPRILSRFRMHPHSKSCAESWNMGQEALVVSERYWSEIGWAQAQRESAAFCRREARVEAWRIALSRITKSELHRIKAVLGILSQAIQSPWRLVQRETWGMILRTLARGIYSW